MFLFSESFYTIDQRREQDSKPNGNKGLHETWVDYNRCATRRANQGLYLGEYLVNRLTDQIATKVFMNHGRIITDAPQKSRTLFG